MQRSGRGMLDPVASSDMPVVAEASSFGFGGTNSHAVFVNHAGLAAALMQSSVQYHHLAFIWQEM